jgi:hypothetical protein
MNFGQFRWQGSIGEFELLIPRDEFVRSLAEPYNCCINELRQDDKNAPDEICDLKAAGYPPFEELLDNKKALREAIGVYLWEEVLAEFVPFVAESARFMINSIESVVMSDGQVSVRGRGYHGSPGFAK